MPSKTKKKSNPHWIALITLLLIGLFIFNLNHTKKQPETKIRVLPATLVQEKETEIIPAASVATVTATLVTTKIATSSSQSSTFKPVTKLAKNSYTIALIGDSMVETMGENTDYLQKSLSAKYPGTEFKLYNYGIGSQNIEQGLARFSSTFSYKTRNYPPIREVTPDIIVIGSFSYNPFAEHDRAKHARLLREMINQARGITPRVYVLAEIAPLKTGFGKGPGGVNWPEDKANLQAAHIIEQLDDTVSSAKGENVPVINAYQASKVDGNYGNKAYVADHDGIHPSIAGHVFMAQIIANILKFN